MECSLEERTAKDIMNNDPKHIPVMMNEVINGLSIKKGGVYVDGTLGLGGHSKSIIDAAGEEGRLIAIDCDEDAMNIAKKNLKEFSVRTTFINDNYRNIDKVLDSLNIHLVDGILLDLGVSSLQLDDSNRGFSLKVDGPLDMRMDKNMELSAFDLVNSLSETEISKILNDFGQERWHFRIAHSIVEHRSKAPINSTRELRHIVMRAIPYNRKWQKIHPATRTFQALRIAVNRELESLNIFLDKCINRLKPNGRICIISFHSLEDRIVKIKFREAAKADQLNLITKKPLRPTAEECSLNVRSRSARLRIAERI